MNVQPRRMLGRLTAEGAPAPLRLLGKALRWLWVFYRQLNQHRAFLRAAGMAYVSLIAVAPLLMLVFGVLGATGLLAPNRTTIEDLLFGTFLGDVPELREILLPALDRMDLSTLGIVGVVGLLMVTARLYLNVETAYNDIFGTPVDRGFGMRVLYFYFVLTAVPVAAGVVAIGAQGVLEVPTISRLVSPVVAFTLLMAALKLFPCRPVTWQAALAGSVVSAVLLEGGVRLFPLYVRVFASDDPMRIVYGSLGLIPVFLLWLYLLWVFVLLGVVVAYTVQNFQSLEAIEFELKETETRFVQAPSVGLAVEVLVRVGAHFEAGKGPVDLERIAEAVACGPRDLGGVMKVLEHAGFLVQALGGWMLARPPEHIDLADVFAAWRLEAWLRNDTNDVVGDAILAALVKSFPGTLADAMGWWPQPDVVPVDEGVPAPPA